jgi:MacB-like periplasmic core domain/HlyD family secretion protein
MLLFTLRNLGLPHALVVMGLALAVLGVGFYWLSARGVKIASAALAFFGGLVAGSALLVLAFAPPSLTKNLPQVDMSRRVAGPLPNGIAPSRFKALLDPEEMPNSQPPKPNPFAETRKRLTEEEFKLRARSTSEADLSPWDRFRKASPAERLNMVQRMPQPDSEFVKVERKDIAATVVERGSFESASASDAAKMQVVARIPESQVSLVRPGQKATIRADAFLNQALTGHVVQISSAPIAQDSFSDVKVFPTQIAIDETIAGLKPGMSAEVSITVATQKKALRVPVQAVVPNGGQTVCFAKTEKEIQERPVKIGLRDNSYVEIVSGLAEGERVVANPRGLARRLQDAPKGDGDKQSRRPPPGSIWIRSRKPTEGEVDVGRTAGQAYGLTLADVERLAKAPNIDQLVPMQILPLEIRHRSRMHRGRVVATASSYAESFPISLEEGAFFTDLDDGQKNNVVVLGSSVAQALFPLEEARAQSVNIGRHAFVVVGVLKEARTGGAIRQDDPNDKVYLPLHTFQERFGERAAFRQDTTPLSVLITVPDADRMTQLVELFENQLEQAHPKRDWVIESSAN